MVKENFLHLVGLSKEARKRWTRWKEITNLVVESNFLKKRKMLQPKRTKFRKQQKGRMKGNAGRGHQLSNGTFGIKSLDSIF